MLKHQSLAGSDNLQHHKHAASVVESARHCDFCCGVVEVKAAQLVNVRKQILAAGKVILQFLHSKAAEPATENEKKQREVCSALTPSARIAKSICRAQPNAHSDQSRKRYSSGDSGAAAAIRLGKKYHAGDEIAQVHVSQLLESVSLKKVLLGDFTLTFSIIIRTRQCPPEQT